MVMIIMIWRLTRNLSSKNKKLMAGIGMFFLPVQENNI